MDGYKVSWSNMLLRPSFIFQKQLKHLHFVFCWQHHIWLEYHTSELGFHLDVANHAIGKWYNLIPLQTSVMAWQSHKIWLNSGQGSNIFLHLFAAQRIYHLVLLTRFVLPHKIIFLQQLLPSYLLRGQLLLYVEEGVRNIIRQHHKLRPPNKYTLHVSKQCTTAITFFSCAEHFCYASFSFLLF